MVREGYLGLLMGGIVDNFTVYASLLTETFTPQKSALMVKITFLTQSVALS